MKEPHPSLQAGSRKESIRPGTSPEPAPGRAVMEDINSRRERVASGPRYARYEWCVRSSRKIDKRVGLRSQ